MKRYLALWLATAAALIAAVAAVNIAIDPYRLYRDDAGIAKPRAGPNSVVAKAYAVQRVVPGALVLGNSRAEIGFDPRHPAWPAGAQPVYNLALPGTGVGTSLNYLRHVLELPSAHVKVVVLGLDLQDYVVDGRPPQSAGPPDARLLGAGASSARMLSRLRDYGQATLTVDALADAVATLAARGDPYAIDLDAQGFNPMRDYLKIASEEGYWRLFRQRDLENARAWLRRAPRLHNADGTEGAPLAQLRQIVALCRERGIDLRLLIYPYHAHQLEIIDATGHWAVFEAWKRLVAGIATEAGVPLWDFSGYDAFTTEPVPARADRRTTMRWYWEGGHFKKELGDHALQRMLADAGEDFGERLTTANVEARLARVRTQRDAYRAATPDDVRDIQALVASQRPRDPGVSTPQQR